jgi:molybdopterin synthase sulfur carrier subunit
MQIEVHLFATLRQGRFRQQALQVPAGSTVTDVCRRLAIEDGEAAILIVNGVAARGDHPLASGDEVSLFPALGGG